MFSSWKKRISLESRFLERKPVPKARRERRRDAAPLLLESLEERLTPAIHTWTNGAGTGLWSNALNWTGGVPTTGESGGTIVVFGTVANQLTSTQNIPGLIVDEIQFATNPGNTINLTNQNLGLNGALEDVNILDTTGGADTITGLGAGQGLVLSGASAGIDVGSSSTLTIQSKITGTVGLITQGAGILNLFAPGGNSYTGATTVAIGTLQLNATSNFAVPGDLTIGDGVGAAGSAVVRDVQSSDILSTAAVTINSDGRLDLNGFSEVIGSLTSSSSTAQVTLGNGVLSIGNAANTSYAGSISGTGNIFKNGTGALTLSGVNTNSGTTFIVNGALITSGGSAIADTGAVNVFDAAGVTFNLTANESIGSLTGGGSLGGNVTLATNTLTVGGDNTTTLYSGVISGAGGKLTKVGTGVLTLSGNSSFTGATTIQAGSLEIDGKNSASPVTLGAGALRGVGTVESITATGGDISPGAGGVGFIGTLTTAPGAFVNTMNGSTFQVDVTTPAASDELVIGNGASLNLTGSTLSVNVLGSATNNVYTIVSSTSGGISGTFTGLPNGKLFTVGGRWFTISYSSTRVTLTDVPPPNGMISGVVFRDFNSNGKQDTGEPGVAGVTVFLDLNANGTLDAGEPTATTSASGVYSFTGLAPGSYSVRQVVFGGTILSAPASGSYSLTVANNSNFANQNFADVFTSITVPLTLPPNTPFPAQGNANADFVEAVYRAVLDRNADPGGLASFTGHLNDASFTRLQVVQAIRNSPEHFGQEIDAFYETLLGRAADPAGRAGWVQELENGVREEQIAFDFLDSPEYLSKGDKFFVDAMYESLLGRTFDPAGEANFLNALGDDTSGNPTHPATMTHAQVINSFLFSTESLSRLVEGYYEVFLQRQADPPGLQSWLTQLQNGLPFLTIGQEFIASDEFYNKAAANN